ncbi:cytidine deaminase [Saccharomycopsis crataegensis]|uniref:Cytidine deaminase n=1 Tax=Saccharomycopsis crataegensis TaxID=43959 RepID=A0AAV5QFY1_9ASCO|nr:cytidine deaminase [Saccharomycopsis crataegensis]
MIAFFLSLSLSCSQNIIRKESTMTELLPLEKSIIHTDHNGLTQEEFANLKEKTIKAKDLSYSPYSNFRVGATILTTCGEYISGANVENASYGACICAERTAITRAVVSGFKSFRAIGISTDLKDKIGSPCGICRQVIREFGLNVSIYLFNVDGSKYFRVQLKDILPLSFGPSDLGLPEHDG